MPRRTTDYRGLAELNRVRLLGAVQQKPGRTLKALAEALGLATSTARDHLGVLAAEGLVSVESRPTGTRGRPPTIYCPVDDPEMNPAAKSRIDRARALGPVLDRVGYSCVPGPVRDLGVEAGEQYGVLVDHLDDSGLEPVADETGLCVSLSACPHLDLVGDERAMACAVHARLLRDVLAQVAGPLRVDEVEPFVTSNTCRLRLLAT